MYVCMSEPERWYLKSNTYVWYMCGETEREEKREGERERERKREGEIEREREREREGKERE